MVHAKSIDPTKINYFYFQYILFIDLIKTIDLTYHVELFIMCLEKMQQAINLQFIKKDIYHGFNCT